MGALSCSSAGRCHGWATTSCEGCGVVAPCARPDCPSCGAHPEILQEARERRDRKRRWVETDLALKRRFGRTWKRRISRARHTLNEWRVAGKSGRIIAEGNRTPARKIKAPWLRERDMRPIMFPELPELPRHPHESCMPWSGEVSS